MGHGISLEWLNRLAGVGDGVGAGGGWGDHGAGVLHGGDGFVVAAAEGVPADLGHLLEHLQAVFEVADAAALVVAPGDGDFDDLVAEAAGDEEKLGVETPALDGLKAEDDLGGFAFEGLEAALGVFVREAHDLARDPVEAAAEEAAVERLVDGLALLVEPAGADSDVGAGVEGGKEALGFFDGRGEVGVGEEDGLADGLEEPLRTE